MWAPTASVLDKAPSETARIHIRAAILDVAMPGLSGIQLQKQIYRVSPHTKVIIMTGRPDSEIRTLALNAGAIAFLAKPIDADAFLSSVRGALGE